MKLNLSVKYNELLKFLKNKNFPAPDLAIILGSGLGDFADRFDSKITLKTTELPDYPPSTIIGHEGKIHFVEAFGKNILLFQGRIHSTKVTESVNAFYQFLSPINLAAIKLFLPMQPVELIRIFFQET